MGHRGADEGRSGTLSQALANYTPPPEPDFDAELDAAVVGSVADSGDLVGTLDGQAAVTGDGAFSYAIPIRVPEGPGGLKPDLTLAYNSRGEPGIVGVGWELTGISKITRCRKTLAVDEVVEGVRYDSSDRFCLDGAKLMGVGGTYGADGSEYRTERADYAKIVAYGALRGAPESFKVWGKDGRIREYQAFESYTEGRRRYRGDGIQEDFESVIDTWLLRKVYDRSGNELTYFYDLRVQAGASHGSDLRIELIRYSGDQRSVRFEYEDAWGDHRSRYQNGVDHGELERLRKIKVYAPHPLNSVAWTYELDYDDSPATQRSRLTSVAWCDAKHVCLPPTTFEWESVQEPASVSDAVAQRPRFVRVWQSEQVDLEEHVDWPRPILADFNGDGLDDLLYNVRDPRDADPNYACGGPPGDYAKVLLRLSQGIREDVEAFGEPIDVSSIFQPSEPGRRSTPFDPARTRAADFNGDGDQELFVYSDTSYFDGGQEKYRLYDWDSATQSMKRATSGSFIIQNSQLPIHLADLDGDGRTDVVEPKVFGLGDIRWRFHRSIGAFQLAAPQELGRVTCPQDVNAIDVAGDGRPELAMLCVGGLTTDGNQTVGVAANSTAEIGELRIPSAQDWTYADINGDGLNDAHILAGDGIVRLNSGNGFLIDYELQEAPPWGDFDPDIDAVRFGDFNGDGRDDALVLHTNGTDRRTSCDTTGYTGRPSLMLSDGRHLKDLPDAFADPYGHMQRRWRNNGLLAARGWSAHQLGDVDGNGIPELLTLQGDGPDTWKFTLYAYEHKVGTYDFETKPYLTAEEHIVRVTDGLGEIDEVAYADIAAPAEAVSPPGEFYVAANDCAWPQRCLKRGLAVVRSHEKSNGHSFVGRDSKRSWAYHYEDARADMGGRGFLGFKCVTELDEQRGSVVRTCSDNQTRQPKACPGWIYPYAGLPKSVEVRVPLSDGTDRVRVTRTDYDWRSPRWMNHAVYSMELDRRTVKVKEGVPSNPDLLQTTEVLADSFTQRKVETKYTFDSLGNLLEELETRTAEGKTSIARTKTEFDNHVDNRWLLGLPRYREVERQRTGEPAQKQTERLAHNASNGLLESVTLEPDSGNDLWYKKTFVRGTRGVVERLEEEALNEAKRVTRFQYDEEGLYVRRIENAEGHVTWQATHPAFGSVVLSVDANGVTERRRLDGFGRLRVIDGPDEGDTEIQYGLDGVAGGLPFGASPVAEVVRVTTAGGYDGMRAYDSVGRLLLVGWKTMAGDLAYFVSTPDRLGREGQRLLPFAVGETPAGSVEFEYDGLDRPTKTINADGSVSLRSYPSFFESRVQDEEGRESFVVTDVDSFVVRSGSLDGARAVGSTFTYFPSGNVHTVTDAKGNVLTAEYDVRGRRTKLIDPDAGVRKYWFNGFGEVREERHGAKPNDNDNFLYKDAYAYDRLGRLTTKTNTCLQAGQCRSDGTRRFTWDTAEDGVGSLASATAEADGIVRSYGYDDVGRVNQEKLTVAGATFTTDTLFDNFGRLWYQYYPNIPGQSRQLTQHRYQNGYLEFVERQGAQVYWQAQERTVEGAVSLEAQYEVGGDTTVYREYEHNPLTRRIERMDSTASISGGASVVRQRLRYGFFENGQVETRREYLEFPTDSSQPTARVTDRYAYDYANRLTTWTRTGSGARREGYAFDDIGNLTSASRYTSGGTLQNTQAYAYSGVDGAGPHAPTGYGSTLGYRYDKGGRMKSRLSNGQTELAVAHTSFDLPYSVSRTLSGSTRETSFKYDAFEQRVVKESASQRTVYVGDLYEQRTIKAVGGQPERIEHVFYIHAEGKLVAQITAEGFTKKVHYVHGDPLQSATLTLEQGSSVQTRLYFSPWGERLDQNGASVQARPLEQLTKGFTGHEHDDELALINMRGRLYDPTLRRFLTPDPLSGVPVRFPVECVITPCDDSSEIGPIEGTWGASQTWFGGNESGYSAESSTSGGSTASRLGRSARGSDGTELGVAELNLLSQRAFAEPAARVHSVPIVRPDDLNRYSYANNNPVYYRDPSGHIIETLWDAANVVLGVASAAKNVATGNLAAAAVDAAGVVVDAAATIVPGVPGGAGTAIKVGRAADKAADAAKAAQAAKTAAKNVEKAREVAESAKKAEKVAEASKGAAGGARAATQLHHAWPKYLGGPTKQALEKLPTKVHEQFHAGLDKLLPRNKGTAYYDALSTAEKTRNYEKLVDYTRAFDAKHGTKILDALQQTLKQ